MPMAQPRDTDARMPKGVYANYFEVGHTAFEIVIDFGQRYAQSTAPCHTRIVTSPVYARALLQTLTDSLEEYRAAFGEPSEPANHGDLPSD
jgi:hypothetical protein